MAYPSIIRPSVGMSISPLSYENFDGNLMPMGLSSINKNAINKDDSRNHTIGTSGNIRPFKNVRNHDVVSTRENFSFAKLIHPWPGNVLEPEFIRNEPRYVRTVSSQKEFGEPPRLTSTQALSLQHPKGDVELLQLLEPKTVRFTPVPCLFSYLQGRDGLGSTFAFAKGTKAAANLDPLGPTISSSHASITSNHRLPKKFLSKISFLTRSVCFRLHIGSSQSERSNENRFGARSVSLSMHHRPSPASPPWIESLSSNPVFVHIASTFELDPLFRYPRSLRGPLVGQQQVNQVLFLAECARLLTDIEEFLLKKNVRIKHYKKAHLEALFLKFQATVQELLRSLSSVQISHGVTKKSLGYFDGMLLPTSSSHALESGSHCILPGSKLFECFSPTVMRQQDLQHLRPGGDATDHDVLSSTHIQNTLQVEHFHTPTNPQAHSTQRTMAPGTVLSTSVPRQISSDRIQPVPGESQLIKQRGNGAIYADHVERDTVVELDQDGKLLPSSSSGHASSTTGTQYYCVPVGTNGYRAPECAFYVVISSTDCSLLLVSTKYDIWSLGLLVYRMLLCCEGPYRQRDMAILLLRYHRVGRYIDGVSRRNRAHFANCTPESVIQFASLVEGVISPHILQDCGQLQVEDTARCRVSKVHHRTHVFSGVGEGRQLTSSSKAFPLDGKLSVLNSREKQVFNSGNNSCELKTAPSYCGTVGAGVRMSKFNRSSRVENHRNWKSCDSPRTDFTNDLLAGNLVAARIEPDGNDKQPICDLTRLSDRVSESYNSPVDGTGRLKTWLSISQDSCVSDGTAAVLATGVTKYDRSSSKEDHPKWVCSQVQGNLHLVRSYGFGVATELDGQEELTSSFSNALFAWPAHAKPGEVSGGKPLNTQLSTTEDCWVSQSTVVLQSGDFTGVGVSKYDGSNRKEDHLKWVSYNVGPRADSLPQLQAGSCDFDATFELDDELPSYCSEPLCESGALWPPTSSDETGVVGPLQTQLSFLQNSCVLQGTAVATSGSPCLFRGGVESKSNEDSGKDDPRDSEAEEEESNEESGDEKVKTKETTKDTGYHTMPQASFSGSEPADRELENKSLTLSPFDHQTPQEEEEYPRSQELVFVRRRTWDTPRDIFLSPIEETEGVTDAEHCPMFVPSFTPHHNVSSLDDGTSLVFVLENGSVTSPVATDSGSVQGTNSVETLESECVEHNHELNSTPCLNEVQDVKPFYCLEGNIKWEYQEDY